VRSRKSTAILIDQTRRLCRARLLCAELRAEGLLASAPQVVALLADRLLETLDER
jgi:hypothetical protein